MVEIIRLDTPISKLSHCFVVCNDDMPLLWKERKATDKASALKGVMQEINKNLFPGGTKQIEKETQCNL